MADEYSALLSGTDLSGFQQNIAASDPYGIIGRSLGQWQPNYQYMNGTESFLTSFGKALSSGLLQTYAQDRASDQLSSVVNVLPQLNSDPLSVAAPEGVDSSQFNLLRGSAYLKKAAQESEISNLLKKFTVQSQGEVIGKANAFKALGIDNPDDPKVKQKIKELELAAEEASAGRKSMLSEIGKIKGSQIGYGTEAGDDPNSPAAKLKEAIKKEEDAARAEIKELPAVKTLFQIKTALPRLEQLASVDSKTSDIPFTYAFVQGLDGGVVKDGERYMIQGGNSFLQQYKGLFEGALNGQSELTTQLKQRMVDELKGSQDALGLASLDQAKSRLATAIERGVTNPKNVMPFDSDALVTDLATKEAAKLKALNPNITTQELAQKLKLKFGGYLK